MVWPDSRLDIYFFNYSNIVPFADAYGNHLVTSAYIITTVLSFWFISIQSHVKYNSKVMFLVYLRRFRRRRPRGRHAYLLLMSSVMESSLVDLLRRASFPISVTSTGTTSSVTLFFLLNHFLGFQNLLLDATATERNYIKMKSPLYLLAAYKTHKQLTRLRHRQLNLAEWGRDVHDYKFEIRMQLAAETLPNEYFLLLFIFRCSTSDVGGSWIHHDTGLCRHTITGRCDTVGKRTARRNVSLFSLLIFFSAQLFPRPHGVIANYRLNSLASRERDFQFDNGQQKMRKLTRGNFTVAPLCFIYINPNLLSFFFSITNPIFHRIVAFLVVGLILFLHSAIYFTLGCGNTTILWYNRGFQWNRVRGLETKSTTKKIRLKTNFATNNFG